MANENSNRIPDEIPRIAMTRKKRYEYLIKQIEEGRTELYNADTEDAVNTALNKLVELMEGLRVDSQLADVKARIADVSDVIHDVKLHDKNRKTLDGALQSLINESRNIIKEEQQKENAVKFKKLLVELEKHSEEIAKIIDIDKIFA